MSAVTTITALMREDEATRTLLDLLTTEKMDGSDSTISTTTVTVTTTGAPPVPSTTTTRSDGLQGRWSALKQRLGLKGIICCGSGWNHRSTSSSSALLPADNEFDDADSPPQTPPAVNLATALAEERQLRQLTTSTTAPLLESEFGSSSVPVTPSKVSLMRLMAEAAMEAYEEDGGGGEEAGKSGRCCVCMERKKGAAFIPCGHTLCRVCSREIWVNRGHCPLCNRSIADVLDIF